MDENWSHLLIRPNSEIAGHILTNEEIKVLRYHGYNTLLKFPNGSTVMANNGVMGNLCHTSTFYEIRIEQEYMKNIYAKIQHYDFDGLTPQYMYINENNWAIVTLDKEMKVFNLYYQGKFRCFRKGARSYCSYRYCCKVITANLAIPRTLS